MTAWVLPPDLQSASSAREHLRSALAGTSAAPVAEQAELLVSEVVTNAVVHGRPTVTLEVQVAGTQVRVEVSDCSPRLPVVRDLDLLSTGGRGMALVAALAERWGVGSCPAAGREAGKTVWFEMSAP